MRAVGGGLAAAAFLVSVVVFVVVTSVQSLVFDPSYYESEQVRVGVPQTSGIPLDQLQATDRGIVRYFGNPQESLPQSLAAAGANSAIFNERELIHMEDVRGIIGVLSLSQRFAALYAIMMLVVVFLVRGVAALRLVGRLLVGSAALMVALLLVVGLLTVLDFGQLFLQFHLISFSNDFWQLDPRTDNLIKIFPFPFWYNAMLNVVLRSVVGAAAVAVAGGTLLGPLRRPR